MRKAYLAWPVHLGGVSMELHVTLKYFGSAPVTAEDIKQRLSPAPSTELDLSRALWSRQKFGNAFVLELEGLKPGSRLCRKLVDDLAPNDFRGWRPHITVPKSFWRELDTIEFRDPNPFIQWIGPLTLYVKEDGGEYHAVAEF